MPKYMVLFNPLTHAENKLEPPSGVSGGPMGDTENGVLAVYDVPDAQVEQFKAAVDACSAVLKSEQLGKSGQR